MGAGLAGTDRRAEFERLFLPHQRAAYNLACWLLRHPEDAEDLTQEAYLKAYRSFHQFSGGDPAAWLLAIVRNSCLTLLKRHTRNNKVIYLAETVNRISTDAPVMDQSSLPPQPDVALQRDEEVKQVRAMIRQLPENYRTVLVLREFEELSYRQIADVIGAPVGTVMSRLSRGREKLKHLLEQTENHGQQNEL